MPRLSTMLREQRFDFKMTVEEVSRRSLLTAETIADLESGNLATVSDDIIKKISIGYGPSVEMIMNSLNKGA